MRYTWYIIVMNTEKFRKFKVQGQPGQLNKEVYHIAKEKVTEIKNKVRDCTVDLISGTKGFKPPEDTRAPRGCVWCPYCIKWRVFMWSDTLSVKRCPFCGITESDFYYKKYNGVFTQEKQEWLLHTKRKGD